MKKYILAVLSIALLPAALMAFPYGSCPYRGQFLGGGMFMWIIILLLIIALVFFIYTAAKNKRSGEDIFSFKNGSEEPLQILKKRLAKGEITEDEYERLKEKLS